MAITLVVVFASAIFGPLLFTAPSSGTLSHKEAAGPTATFVNINNVDVHVVETPYSGPASDEAPPLILLLHGFGASTFSWREVQEPLSALGDVISYDRPGFGFTQRPTSWQGTNPFGMQGQLDMLSGMIETFGKNRSVVLVGHSAGGQLAAEFALNNANAVSALVLVDPSILTTGGVPDAVLPVLFVPQIDHVAPALMPLVAGAGDALLRQSFVDQNLLTSEVYDGYHAPQTVIGWERGFWEFAKAPRSASNPELLAGLSMPVLLITGDNDTVVPTADTIALKELIPGSTLVIIEQAGHLPQEERPEEFVRALTQSWDALHEAFSVSSRHTTITTKEHT